MDVLNGDMIRQLCVERSRGQAEHQWHDQISRWHTKKRRFSKGLYGGIWGDNTSSDKDLLEISILRRQVPFPLRDLCLILQLASSSASQYNVNRYQCSWFCCTILKLLEEELDMISIQEGRDFHRGSTYRNIVLHEVELRSAEEKDSHDTIAKVFEAAMANNRETREGSELNIGRSAVEALFSAHSDRHTRNTQAAKGALHIIAKRVEEEVSRNAAIEQMSPVNRAFARATIATPRLTYARRSSDSDSWGT